MAAAAGAAADVPLNFSLHASSLVVPTETFCSRRQKTFTRQAVTYNGPARITATVRNSHDRCTVLRVLCVPTIVSQGTDSDCVYAVETFHREW